MKSKTVQLTGKIMFETTQIEALPWTLTGNIFLTTPDGEIPIEIESITFEVGDE